MANRIDPYDAYVQNVMGSGGAGVAAPPQAGDPYDAYVQDVMGYEPGATGGPLSVEHLMNIGRNLGSGAIDLATASPQALGAVAIEAGERAEEVPSFKDTFMPAQFEVMEKWKRGEGSLGDVLTMITGPLHDISQIARRYAIGPAAKMTNADEQLIKWGKGLIKRNQDYIAKKLPNMGPEESGHKIGPFDTGRVAYGVGSGVTSLLAALGVSWAASKIAGPGVGSTAAAALFGVYQKGSMYQALREQGFNPTEAARQSTLAGGIEGGLEKLGLDIFIKNYPKGIRGAILNAADEVIQEWAQQTGENAIVRFGGLDEMRGLFEGAGFAALVGGLVGAPTSLVLSGLKGELRNKGISEEQAEEIGNKYSEKVIGNSINAMNEFIERQIPVQEVPTKEGIDLAENISKGTEQAQGEAVKAAENIESGKKEVSVEQGEKELRAALNKRNMNKNTRQAILDSYRSGSDEYKRTVREGLGLEHMMSRILRGNQIQPQVLIYISSTEGAQEEARLIRALTDDGMPLAKAKKTLNKQAEAYAKVVSQATKEGQDVQDKAGKQLQEAVNIISKMEKSNKVDPVEASSLKDLFLRGQLDIKELRKIAKTKRPSAKAQEKQIKQDIDLASEEAKSAMKALGITLQTDKQKKAMFDAQREKIKKSKLPDDRKRLLLAHLDKAEKEHVKDTVEQAHQKMVQDVAQEQQDPAKRAEAEMQMRSERVIGRVRNLLDSPTARTINRKVIVDSLLDVINANLPQDLEPYTAKEIGSIVKQVIDEKIPAAGQPEERLVDQAKGVAEEVTPDVVFDDGMWKWTNKNGVSGFEKQKARAEELAQGDEIIPEGAVPVTPSKPAGNVAALQASVQSALANPNPTVKTVATFYNAVTALEDYGVSHQYDLKPLEAAMDAYQATGSTDSNLRAKVLEAFRIAVEKGKPAGIDTIDLAVVFGEELGKELGPRLAGRKFRPKTDVGKWYSRIAEINRELKRTPDVEERQKLNSELNQMFREEFEKAEDGESNIFKLNRAPLDQYDKQMVSPVTRGKGRFKTRQPHTGAGREYMVFATQSAAVNYVDTLSPEDPAFTGLYNLYNMQDIQNIVEGDRGTFEYHGGAYLLTIDKNYEFPRRGVMVSEGGLSSRALLSHLQNKVVSRVLQGEARVPEKMEPIEIRVYANPVTVQRGLTYQGMTKQQREEFERFRDEEIAREEEVMSTLQEVQKQAARRAQFGRTSSMPNEKIGKDMQAAAKYNLLGIKESSAQAQRIGNIVNAMLSMKGQPIRKAIIKVEGIFRKRGEKQTRRVRPVRYQKVVTEKDVVSRAKHVVFDRSVSVERGDGTVQPYGSERLRRLTQEDIGKVRTFEVAEHRKEEDNWTLERTLNYLKSTGQSRMRLKPGVTLDTIISDDIWVVGNPQVRVTTGETLDSVPTNKVETLDDLDRKLLRGDTDWNFIDVKHLFEDYINSDKAVYRPVPAMEKRLKSWSYLYDRLGGDNHQAKTLRRAVIDLAARYPLHNIVANYQKLQFVGKAVMDAFKLQQANRARLAESGNITLDQELAIAGDFISDLYALLAAQKAIKDQQYMPDRPIHKKDPVVDENGKIVEPGELSDEYNASQEGTNSWDIKHGIVKNLLTTYIKKKFDDNVGISAIEWINSLKGKGGRSIVTKSGKVFKYVYDKGEKARKPVLPQVKEVENLKTRLDVEIKNLNSIIGMMDALSEVALQSKTDPTFKDSLEQQYIIEQRVKGLHNWFTDIAKTLKPEAERYGTVLYSDALFGLGTIFNKMMSYLVDGKKVDPLDFEEHVEPENDLERVQKQQQIRKARAAADSKFKRPRYTGDYVQQASRQGIFYANTFIVKFRPWGNQWTKALYNAWGAKSAKDMTPEEKVLMHEQVWHAMQEVALVDPRDPSKFFKTEFGNKVSQVWDALNVDQKRVILAGRQYFDVMGEMLKELGVLGSDVDKFRGVLSYYPMVFLNEEGKPKSFGFMNLKSYGYASAKRKATPLTTEQKAILARLGKDTSQAGKDRVRLVRAQFERLNRPKENLKIAGENNESLLMDPEKLVLYYTEAMSKNIHPTVVGTELAHHSFDNDGNPMMLYDSQTRTFNQMGEEVMVKDIRDLYEDIDSKAVRDQKEQDKVGFVFKRYVDKYGRSGIGHGKGRLSNKILVKKGTSVGENMRAIYSKYRNVGPLEKRIRTAATYTKGVVLNNPFAISGMALNTLLWNTGLFSGANVFRKAVLHAMPYLFNGAGPTRTSALLDTDMVDIARMHGVRLGDTRNAHKAIMDGLGTEIFESDATGRFNAFKKFLVTKGRFGEWLWNLMDLVMVETFRTNYQRALRAVEEGTLKITPREAGFLAANITNTITGMGEPLQWFDKDTAAFGQLLLIARNSTFGIIRQGMGALGVRPGLLTRRGGVSGGVAQALDVFAGMSETEQTWAKGVYRRQILGQFAGVMLAQSLLSKLLTGKWPWDDRREKDEDGNEVGAPDLSNLFRIRTGKYVGGREITVIPGFLGKDVRDLWDLTYGSMHSIIAKKRVPRYVFNKSNPLWSWFIEELTGQDLYAGSTMPRPPGLTMTESLKRNVMRKLTRILPGAEFIPVLEREGGIYYREPWEKAIRLAGFYTGREEGAPGQKGSISRVKRLQARQKGQRALALRDAEFAYDRGDLEGWIRMMARLYPDASTFKRQIKEWQLRKHNPLAWRQQQMRLRPEWQ